MSIVHDIVHTTSYRYKEPVEFGVHRVMFRPRDSHDQRVLATDLQVSPASDIRLIQDTYSNSLALVQPQGAAEELRFTCSFTIDHVPGEDTPPVSPSAEFLPFTYSPDERIDLEHFLRPHYDDPDGTLIAWVHQFLAEGSRVATLDLLARINAHIGQTLTYSPRDEEGTQSPVRTLALGGGSCRDYALLMMEAVRRLGVAARFVSGYLYDEALDEDGTVAMIGSGATHAWMQVFIPGAGWITYDPTNNLTGDSRLIRVAVVRDPALASPISGSWFGAPEAYLGMSAEVQVHRRNKDNMA